VFFGLDKAVNSGSLRFIMIDGLTVSTQSTCRLHIEMTNLSLRQAEVMTNSIG